MPTPPPGPGLDILIVDDEANIRKTLALALEMDGHRTAAAGNARDGLELASSRHFDLLFLDLRLGTDRGTAHIPEFIAASPWIKIVVITAYASVETAVEAMRLGAADYLPKPFTPEQVRTVTGKVAENKRVESRVAALAAGTGGDPGADLDSRSAAMQRCLSLARQAAASDAVVMLRGESGTGKSVLARLIHAWSPRAAKPFNTVSCPSLSSELLESELFGHARGAFTGALRDHPGRIAATDGGTLFLDEIGDLPPAVQPKLLRFLQEHAYERVGESATRKADIRILAATNLDLEKLAREGRFREDLMYRLNVVQIELPPLRDRAEDIPVLAHRFLAFYAARNRRQFLGYAGDAEAALRAHSWPGNLRELRNRVERAVVLARGDRLTAADLGLNPGSVPARVQVGDAVTLDALEEAHIRRVLAAGKSLEEAARILGIDTATLWRRRKKYGI